eukprot:gene6054-7276_t
MNSIYSKTVYTFYDSVAAGHLENEPSEERLRMNFKMKSKKSAEWPLEFGPRDAARTVPGVELSVPVTWTVKLLDAGN